MLMAGGHVVMDSEENEEPAEEADNSIAEDEDDYFEIPVFVICNS